MSDEKTLISILESNALKLSEDFEMSILLSKMDNNARFKDFIITINKISALLSKQLTENTTTFSKRELSELTVQAHNLIIMLVNPKSAILDKLETALALQACRLLANHVSYHNLKTNQLVYQLLGYITLLPFEKKDLIFFLEIVEKIHRNGIDYHFATTTIGNIKNALSITVENRNYEECSLNKITESLGNYMIKLNAINEFQEHSPSICLMIMYSLALRLNDMPQINRQKFIDTTSLNPEIYYIPIYEKNQLVEYFIKEIYDIKPEAIKSFRSSFQMAQFSFVFRFMGYKQTSLIKLVEDTLAKEAIDIAEKNKKKLQQLRIYLGAASSSSNSESSTAPTAIIEWGNIDTSLNGKECEFYY